MDYAQWLKNKDLEYKNGILFFANLNTIDLAKKYGTPLYVINEQMIRKRYQKLKAVLDSEYKNNAIYFAMKANSNLSVLKILYSEGAGFDCTSVGEIFACFKAGIPASKLIYTGNMFTDDDLEFAVKNDVLVNLDSISQLKRLDNAYKKIGKKKKPISFRFNPEFGAGHHAHTITAGKEVKFGILDDQVIEAYKKAQELGFDQFGIHIHIGSGILDARDYDKATERYTDTIAKLQDTLNIQFQFVDFGGGLGIPYKPEQDPLDLDMYKQLVVTRFKRLVEAADLGTATLKIEPGRFLSAEASILLVQINTIKDNGYKLFAGINAGFNTLVRPTMYGSYHHIIVCNNDRPQNLKKYDIAGPICESGDILGKDRDLPELLEGDYLSILDAGAYGFAMSSPYNSRPRPKEVLINKGESMVIREPETYEDLLTHQKIPPHLI